MVTNQNPQFYSLYATLLNYNNWGTAVYNLDRDWGQVVKFIEKLNGGKSRAVSSPTGIYQKMTKPRQEVVAQTSGAPVQAGANLVINFVDPTYEGFRVKDLVMDDKYNYGRVISKAAGTITIEPFPITATLTATSHFLASSFVMTIVDISGNFNSLGKTNLYKSKVPVDNYASVQRDSCQLARREKFNSFMGQNGVAYYWSEGEREMFTRFYKDYVAKCLFSIKGTGVSSVEGVINGTEGVRDAIINQGGYYVSSTSALTQAVWEDMLNYTSTSYARTFQDKVFLMGRNAWQTISGFYANNINFTVSQRTAGGQDLNFDVKTVTIAGITATVMILDFLNDPVKFPAQSNIPGIRGTKMSNSIYMIDASPIPSDGAEMQMLPSIEKFHFANDERAEESIYKLIGGMTGGGPGNDTGPSVYNNFQLTSTSVDGVSMEVLGDNGISCIADNWALWELAD